jgi:drug/metabolite transporter (DMT)-like permease
MTISPSISVFAKFRRFPMRIALAGGHDTATQLPLPLRVAVFCLLWSSAFSVAKLALADCPPLLLLAARFLIAGAIMLGAAALTRTTWCKLTRFDLIALVGLGIANNGLYLGLNYVGIGTISSGLSALIVSTNPVLTALVAALVLDERMTWRKATGLLLGVGGVAFIVQGRITGGIDNSLGIMFTFAALVALVSGTILFKRLAPNGGLWIGNGVQNLSGGFALLPFAFTLESVGQVTPSWRLLIALAYLALFVSVVGYLLWFHLLTTSGATAASAYHFLMPPLGMLFGWLLLGEHVALVDLIGIVPVALGIYLVTRAAPPPRQCEVGLSSAGRGGTITPGARTLREDRTRKGGVSICPRASIKGIA